MIQYVCLHVIKCVKCINANGKSPMKEQIFSCPRSLIHIYINLKYVYSTQILTAMVLLPTLTIYIDYI